MKFIVAFKNDFSTYMDEIYVPDGLSLLREARFQLNHPVTVEMVQKPPTYNQIYNALLEVEISEEIAEVSAGLFEHRSTICVDVYGSLGSYITLVASLDGAFYGDGAKIVTWSWELDKMKLIHDWAKAGYPLQWKKIVMVEEE